MDLQSYINRKLGLCTPLYYDAVLKRLVVSKKDNMSWSSFVDFPIVNSAPPIFACRFSENPGYEHILATANEIGKVEIKNTFKMGNVSDQAVNGFTCHSNAIFDLAWMHHDTKLITVSGDHTSRLWDVGSEMTSISLFFGHERSIKTAVFRYEDDAVFATGARDGNIFIWDVRVQSDMHTSRPESSIPRCHPILNTTPASVNKRWIEPGRNSITGLAFQNDTTLISCGAGDGNIKVWDLRKNYSVFTRAPLSLHSIPYCGNFRNKCGYTNLVIDQSRCKLYSSCMDNVIYCFNISTYNAQPDMKYIGHDSATFYIKNSLSPDGKYLVSGSSDENAYIWNVNYREPIVKLVGHSAEVTCATWCKKGEVKIVTCSDDARIKIWRVGNEWPEDDEKFDLRGASEEVNIVHAPCSALEITPQQQKKRGAPNDVTPNSSFKKIKRRDSEAADRSGKRNKNTKRSLIDILNSDSPNSKKVKRDFLSPIQEENACVQKENLGLGLLDWKCTDSDYHSKRIKLSQDNNMIGMLSETLNSYSVTLHMKQLLKTPTKTTSVESNLIKENDRCGGVHVSLSKLPNFAVDGVAPHKSLMSPRKKRAGTDWLTAILGSKRIKMENDAPLSVISPRNSQYTVSCDRDASPGYEKSKIRRNSFQMDTTPKRTKPNRTLYNYFQVLDQ